MSDVELWRELGQQLRVDAIRPAADAGSGHPTSAMSAADLMAVLLAKYLRYDFDNPQNPHNDHLVFSKGHASPLLYAMFRAAGAITDERAAHASGSSARVFEGHPTPRIPWVDVATGSLGQGLPIAVGIALAGKPLDRLAVPRLGALRRQRDGRGLDVGGASSTRRTTSSTTSSAIIDVNRLGQRGETMLGWNIAAYAAAREAFGWHAIEIDGHDVEAIDRAYAAGDRQPTASPSDRRADDQGQGRARGRGQERLARQGRSTDADAGDRRARRRAATCRSTPRRRRTDAAAATGSRRRGRSAAAVRGRREGRDAQGVRRRARGARRGATADVVALDGEVSNSTFAEEFATPIPDRYFEMYIAEQQMVAAAVGMQVRGWRPFASTFAAFFARAYDFIRMAAISRANICLARLARGRLDRRGRPVADGARGPGLVPRRARLDGALPERREPDREARRADGRPRGHLYLRTTRASDAGALRADEPFPIGGSRSAASDADDVAIVGAGITLHEALEAADTLAREGIAARVIDLYSVKPIDAATLAGPPTRPAASSSSRTTGPRAGSARPCSRRSGTPRAAPVASLAPREMPHSGTPAELLAEAGIDAAGIAAAARSLVQAAAAAR